MACGHPLTVTARGLVVWCDYRQPATIEPPKWAPRNSSPRVGAPASPKSATAAQLIPNQVRPHVVAAADPAGPPPNAVAWQRAGQSAAAEGTAEPNRGHLA